MVGLYRRLIRDLGHGHGGGPGQNLRKHAGVGRVEVLHQDEGHAGIDRQGLEHVLDGFDSARRRADADDREGWEGLLPCPFFDH